MLESLVRYLLIAVFASSALNAYSYPPHDEVYAHNTALTLLGVDYNPYGPSPPPTLQQPVSFFFVKALTAMPSVGDTISSERPPKILWSWGSSYAQSLSEGKTEDCGDVSTNVTFLYGAASFSEESALDGDGQTRSDGIYANTFSILFSASELAQKRRLDVTITGTLWLVYSKTRYEVKCVTVCGSNGCMATKQVIGTAFPPVTHIHTSSSELSYAIEGSGSRGILLEPLTRTSRPNATVVFLEFSNKTYYRASLAVDGETRKDDFFQSFTVRQGSPQGEQHIEAQDIASPAKNSSTNALLSHLGLQSDYRQMYELTAESEGGGHKYSFAFYGLFGGADQTTERITAKKQTALSVDGCDFKLTTDEKPLEGKQIRFKAGNETAYSSTDNEGKAAPIFSATPYKTTAYFDGDDEYLPSEAQTLKFQKIENEATRLPPAYESAFLTLLLAGGLAAARFT